MNVLTRMIIYICISFVIPIHEMTQASEDDDLTVHNIINYPWTASDSMCYITKSARWKKIPGASEGTTIIDLIQDHATRGGTRKQAASKQDDSIYVSTPTSKTSAAGSVYGSTPVRLQGSTSMLEISPVYSQLSLPTKAGDFRVHDHSKLTLDESVLHQNQSNSQLEIGHFGQLSLKNSRLFIASDVFLGVKYSSSLSNYYTSLYFGKGSEMKVEDFSSVRFAFELEGGEQPAFESPALTMLDGGAQLEVWKHSSIQCLNCAYIEMHKAAQLKVMDRSHLVMSKEKGDKSGMSKRNAHDAGLQTMYDSSLTIYSDGQLSLESAAELHIARHWRVSITEGVSLILKNRTFLAFTGPDHGADGQFPLCTIVQNVKLDSQTVIFRHDTRSGSIKHASSGGVTTALTDSIICSVAPNKPAFHERINQLHVDPTPTPDEWSATSTLTKCPHVAKYDYAEKVRTIKEDRQKCHASRMLHSSTIHTMLLFAITMIFTANIARTNF